MFIADCFFYPNEPDGEQADRLLEAVKAYTEALRENGQLCGEVLLGWVESRLRATAYAARPDALWPGYDSSAVKKHLERVSELCTETPIWNIVDDTADEERDYADWRLEDSLYLFTHAFLSCSPVRAGSTGDPIPPYLFPLTDQQRSGIHQWAGAYRHYERVWLDSKALEPQVYKQMSDSRSELALRGRQYCQVIEAATEVATYYALDFYSEHHPGRQPEQCPDCGGDWRRAEESELTPEGGIDCFDFRCDRCRLILFTR